jgi:NADPH:quinone reductase-like Zn-dependent oxidoreductase
MKAVVRDRYGPPEVLRLAEVATPIPGDRDIRVRIRATTVTSADRRLRSLDVPVGFGLMVRLVFGITAPRQPILGFELAGEVEAVGAAVDRFAVGDQVFALCGSRMGCHAEYQCLPQDGAIAHMPQNLGFQEAAALAFGGATALDFFRRARLQPGERVLINGASGAVGTAALQLARHFGAETTAVCSGANAALVKSLGASDLIDYTREDFTRNGRTYDVIVDTIGNAGYSRSRDSLSECGRLLLVAAGLPDMLPIPWVALSSRKRIIAGPAGERAEDLRLLAQLAAAGAFKPVIDRSFRFEQIVAAHQYVDSGRKRGNVVITDIG